MMDRSKEVLVLRVEEKRLLAEEKWILEALDKIKSQMMSLKVEQMQLTSMLRESQRSKDQCIPEEHSPPVEKLDPIDVKLLDTVESSVNTKTLDLSVMNELDSILTGNFYAEFEESDDELIS